MKFPTLILLSLLIAVLFGCSEGNSSALKPNNSLNDEISEICEHYSDQLSGALFVKLAATEVICGFGIADVETGAQNSPDSIYLIASTSKNYTAASVLRLAELRKDFSIDAEIASFFPEYSGNDLQMNGRSIRVSDLLNHTSGIPNAYANEDLLAIAFQEEIGFDQILEAAITEGEKLKVETGHSLVSEPGTTYSYSNTGYIFLGEILRRVTSDSYGVFADAYLFGPASVSDTSIGPPKTNPFVKSYDLVDGQIVDYEVANYIKVRHDGDVFTDGNVYTTLRMLDKWVRALTAGKIISAASLDKMLTPGLGNYGYGWVVDSEDKNRFIEHGGYWIGYSTTFCYYPELFLGIGFYSNHPIEDALEDEFLNKIRAVALRENSEG